MPPRPRARLGRRVLAAFLTSAARSTSHKGFGKKKTAFYPGTFPYLHKTVAVNVVTTWG